MASRDFADEDPKFIQTRKEEQSPVFEVISNLDVVNLNHELVVRVDARRSADEIITDITNDVDIIPATGGQGGGGEDDTLNFDIVLERNGPNEPERGDFIAGEDTITATVNVTNGEIVGDIKVKWFTTADHFPRNVENIWNNGDLP